MTQPRFIRAIFAAAGGAGAFFVSDAQLALVLASYFFLVSVGNLIEAIRLSGFN